MEKFYLTISSDSKCEFEVHNVTSKFRVHLGRVLELKGRYEVALCELFYPSTLLNVTSEDCFITREINAVLGKTVTTVENCTTEEPTDPHYCVRLKDKVESFEHTMLHKINMENNYYHNNEQFLSDFNDKFQHFISCETVIDKTHLTCHQTASEKERIIFALSPQLENIMGFANNSKFEPGFVYVSDLTLDLRKGIPQLLSVCTDLVADQIINNTHDKVLRTFHVSPQNYIYGFQQKESFNKLIFVPVVKKNIEYVDIYIKQQNGLPASFTHGTLKLVLLFRRTGNE
jgi:hypothetical protein